MTAYLALAGVRRGRPALALTEAEVVAVNFAVGVLTETVNGANFPPEIADVYGNASATLTGLLDRLKLAEGTVR